MLKKKKLRKKDYERFLEEFQKFKEECNSKHKYKESSKYYLIIVDNQVGIELENNEVNIFVKLGYFNHLGDCQKAREKFKNIIIELNENGYWD
jgi:hypothetical protein